MKATITLFAALLVSACSLNAARAQDPMMIVPVGHAKSGGDCGCGAGGGAGGGCASGNCGSGHKPSAYTKLFNKGTHGGCNNGIGGCGNNGCGNKCSIFGFLCKPKPSNAPSCFKADYPLGFPNHPYVRSPRDYFMHDQYGPYGQFGY